MWLFGNLNRSWERLMRRVRAENIKIEPLITEQLAGAGVADHHVRWALATMKSDPTKWGDDEMKKFAGLLRDASKPMIIAANKVDVAPPEFVARLKALDEIVVPTCAAAEFALRMADKSGAVGYPTGEPRL